MYDDEPLGRIGWLKGQMFRAGRCIVDTGMHTMGWSQEKAVATLGDLMGDAMGARFDIKAFHDAGLLAGAMPLDVLGRRVGDYIRGARA